MAPVEALALQLFYLSEQSVREIMQVTGWTSSKVKVTLHRARSSFARELERRWGTEMKDLL